MGNGYSADLTAARAGLSRYATGKVGQRGQRAERGDQSTDRDDGSGGP